MHMYSIQVDESGEIICLEQGCPWKKHLYALIEKLSLPEFCVKLVVFKHTIDEDCWMVQASVHGTQALTCAHEG